MHSYWLQFFQRDLMERGIVPKSQMPVVTAGDLPEDAEPTEDDDEEIPDDTGYDEEPDTARDNISYLN